MFDASQVFVFNIPGNAGLQKVTLRFPTDQEWLAYHRARKLIDKGRETEVKNSAEAELALLGAIAPQAAADLDVDQRALICGRLVNSAIESADIEGPEIAVGLRFFGGFTSHRLKMPSAGQLKRAESATVPIALNHGRTEYRTNIETIAAIYDDLKVSIEGYAAGTPIVHKVAVIRACASAIREAIEGDAESF
jgi:hypothetical protein